MDTVSYLHSIITMALSCIISEIKRNSGRKSQLFILPCIRRPRYAGPHQSSHTVWYAKTKTVWLLDSEKSLRMRLAILTEYRRVTDRRIDRHLARLHIPRYA